MNRLELARAALVALASATYLAIAMHLQKFDEIGGDAVRYLNMADRPRELVAESPFASRVLEPFVAGLLPVDSATAFEILTVTSIALAAGIFYLVGVCLQDQMAGLLAAALFVVSPAVAFITKDPWLVDPPAYTVLAAVLLLLLHGRLALLAVVLAAGVWVRETVLFVMASLVVVAWHHRLRPRLGWALMLALPLLALIALRLTPVWYGERPPNYDYFGAANLQLVTDLNRQVHGSLLKAARSAFVQSLGHLWLLVLLAWPARSRLRFELKAWTVLVPVTVLATAFVTDWERGLGYCIVVAAPIAAVLMRRVIPSLVVVLCLFAIGRVTYDFTHHRHEIQAVLVLIGGVAVVAATRPLRAPQTAR